MSQVTKGLIAFVIIMLVGVIIVSTSGKSDKEQASDAALRTGSMLSKYGHDKCKKAIKEELKKNVYSPDKTDSDYESWVEVSWTKEKSGFDAMCKYVKLKGIVTLVIDGKTIKSE